MGQDLARTGSDNEERSLVFLMGAWPSECASLVRTAPKKHNNNNKK